jgi:hypothetical protein
VHFFRGLRLGKEGGLGWWRGSMCNKRFLLFKAEMVSAELDRYLKHRFDAWQCDVQQKVSSSSLSFPIKHASDFVFFSVELNHKQDLE